MENSTFKHQLSPFLAAVLQRAANRGCKWAKDKLELEQQLRGEQRRVHQAVPKTAARRPDVPLEAAWEKAKAKGPAAKARFMAENRDAIRAYLRQKGELK